MVNYILRMESWMQKRGVRKVVEECDRLKNMLDEIEEEA